MVGDINIGTIIAVYVFFVYLFLVGAYLIAYSIDRITYLTNKKRINLKFFSFLFAQYKKNETNTIAIDTFVHELLVLLLFLLSTTLMIISFFVSDIIKVILIAFCFLLSASLTTYLSVKENKLKKKSN